MVYGIDPLTLLSRELGDHRLNSQGHVIPSIRIIFTRFVRDSGALGRRGQII